MLRLRHAIVAAGYRWVRLLPGTRTVQINLFDFLYVLNYLVTLQVVATVTMNILTGVVLTYLFIALLDIRVRKQALFLKHVNILLLHQLNAL